MVTFASKHRLGSIYFPVRARFFVRHKLAVRIGATAADFGKLLIGQA
jgi:hypothetical protein